MTLSAQTIKHFTFFTLLSALLLIGCAVSCGTAEKEREPSASAADTSVSSEAPVEVSMSDLSMELGFGITRQIRAVGGSHIEWQSSDESIVSVDNNGNVKGVDLGECVVTATNEWGSSAECRIAVKKTCYLTFDDGPAGSADNLLDALKETDVKATFFLVETVFFPIVERMASEGHALGLHTRRYHSYKTQFSYFIGLDLMNDHLEELTGQRSNMIRFPGGSNNELTTPRNMRRVVNGAHDLGYRVFDWTTSVGDASAGACYERSCRMIYSNCTHKQEIVLLHDKDFTPNVIRKMVPVLREQGYVFETLDHYPEDSYEFKCKYSFNDPDYPAQSVAFGKSEYAVEVGKGMTLKAKTDPEYSTDFIVWSSSDTSVVKVDKGGNLTGVEPGEAEITAKTTSGATTRCRIVVLQSSESGE